MKKTQKRRFKVQKLEARVAPRITVQNPGGQTPQSDNALQSPAIDAVNPAGKAPPGQN
jgi:hypothetical protein